MAGAVVGLVGSVDRCGDRVAKMAILVSEVQSGMGRGNVGWRRNDDGVGVVTDSLA